MLDFNKICRTCLTDKITMKNLFDVCTPEMFNYCTSLEISSADLLPQQICESCAELITKLYQFKQAVIRSEFVLKQQVPQVKIENSDHIDILEINVPAFEELPSPEPSPPLFVDEDDEPLVNQKKTQQKCRKKSDIKVELKQKEKNKKTVAKANIELVKNESDQLKTRNEKMRCLKCDKVLNSYESFEIHMRKHFGKKPDIRCEICNKTFQTLASLKSHNQIHDGRRECKICGKKFFNPVGLRNHHEIIHEGIKKHVCHVCGAKFTQSHNLKAHLLAHNKVKNYECPQCHKKYATLGNLKQHLVRHTDVKNHVCTICDKKFFIKSELTSHLRLHKIREKQSRIFTSFTCEFCNKTYKSKGFLIIHMRTHTGERPHACEFCSKTFILKCHLHVHRMTHTGEKPHKCETCGKGFIHLCALRQHKKNHLGLKKGALKKI